MINAYWRLMRFDKPIGIFLLLWPTYWALWLANHGMPPLKLLLIFSLGTVFMRAAGCVINDIADRDFDGHVTRTKKRPLASGELTVRQACAALMVMLLLSASLLFFLNKLVIILAMIGLLLTFIYPFCKRFLPTPQMVLGFAFSWGIPMAFAASQNTVPMSAIWLMLLTYCWIVAYDSAYAMSDIKDDLTIGIHSTAIFFGRFDKIMIGILQGAVTVLWIVIAKLYHLPMIFYGALTIATMLFVYQQFLIRHREEKACFRAFLNNHYYGLVIWLGLVISLL